MGCKISEELGGDYKSAISEQGCEQCKGEVQA